MVRSVLTSCAALAAVVLTTVVGVVPLGAAPAHAAGGVSVDNGGQGAVIDSTYSSTLSISGRGFQSIKGGHGGVYVWFGTVSGNWRPSKGGVSGVNYRYVPDKESKGNKGFQRYVAFPGSDTAASANGGTMTADGSWRVNLLVPGPTFQAVGRNGSVVTVDCRKQTCGVITIGAHGVKNANNETFTPVRVADLQSSNASTDKGSTTTTEVPQQGATGGQDKGGVKVAKRASLEVDRAAAVPGRALSFVAQGLTPGSQVTAVLDDGIVATGPHLVGQDGVVAGVLQLPADLPAGTHELRTFGAGKSASVKFGVSAAAVDDAVGATSVDTDRPATAALVFAGVAAAVFLGALVLTLVRLLRGRRAQA
ncbi:MAG: hypothetical protein ACI379_03160 [Nocardioides sp.]|uniref:hypothetical protein n=1 Tax=Nocardioides sp. TaxID=35761 RepID=UPI003F0ADD6C